MEDKPSSIRLVDTDPTYRDVEATAINGFLGLAMHVALTFLNIVLTVLSGASSGLTVIPQLITVPLWFVMFNSYVIVNPNEAVVAQFFGKYASTLKKEGFQFFLNPLYQKLSLIHI